MTVEETAIMPVRIEKQEAVTTVIIDRPERKNAVDARTARELADAIAQNVVVRIRHAQKVEPVLL